MNKTKQEDALELLNDLEKLFQDKIGELAGTKGYQTERHAFIYYRSLVWQIRDKLK
jgi:hypothetical protein